MTANGVQCRVCARRLSAPPSTECLPHNEYLAAPIADVLPIRTHLHSRARRPLQSPDRPAVPGCVRHGPAPRRCWSPSPSGQGSCRVRTCPVRSTRATASCPCPSAASNARATHGGGSVCEEARPALAAVTAAAGRGRQWCWHFSNAWRRLRMPPAQGMCAARPGQFSVGVRGVGRAVCGSG